ncbi:MULTISPECIES: polyprenyl synthetase family protein [Streptomycetaceae]|uniref:Geranylgeranyl diphosphate synthase n=1 Tax=Streptantibioticus cattleyicolor (strain ATCC 35852 / DSM 46488 / JCM 4925 / NBRC 14057 / NRRL 8057) TaxID=1003195 RepID=F8JW07_STREN|nr:MULTISPECIES: polyprenyl synthetase family protein [Streptomycetaceae]AEW92846.1 geranylgeranyl diphosphate synthase [Streptantibioticus cattleyicolor NRRL 8057 = DSM 46488]MYS57601.1 polyprenyl synthetase family protein [Streptomyces sp. SID5468]CCB73198.1 Geranylgeranyl diphosphate synthase [Streptantibioticus cattleyicolor NRRL 8057 = DSM 46488]
MPPAPTTATLGTVLPDLDTTRQDIEAILDEFLRTKSAQATAHNMPPTAASVLADFLHAGGKRLRPLLCVLGWHAAGGPAPAPAEVLQVSAALEMFHAFALIHDDVMDDSDTRRGHPTVHRVLAVTHATGRRPRTADRIGTGAAILIGDLALCWTDELIHTAHLTARQLRRVLTLLDVMRTEVMYGQYLDVTASGAPNPGLESALAIVRYKTAKYTVERPLHIGAALAGAPQRVLDALTAYAMPLGEAFQLRDDLLGVFGDPEVTGKSRLDDLREGKHTALIALALRESRPDQVTLLRELLGRPDIGEDEAARIGRILTASGARAHVEELIADRRETVLRFLADDTALAPQVLPHLRRLADTMTRRTS